ncbi:MAG TPA: acyl carrier protein [Xanthobacteraceae bacterium]|jgi:acyl carrier protein|nr:acyl carrier protein [Xanthobacteraceae bacterium]
MSPSRLNVEHTSAAPDAAVRPAIAKDEMVGESLRAIVLAEIQAVAGEHGRRLGPLADDTLLMDTGLDSFSLAVLVVRLEDRLGLDPFSSPDEAAFPLTVGDFVRCYKDARP